MTRLPDHLRLQEESPVLRVTCEMIDGTTTKQRLVTTDAQLLSDVMKTLISFDLRAVTRKKLIDLLKTRSGRYGHVRAFDDATKAYVGISVTPDPVLHVQMSVGDHEVNELVLLTELPRRIDALFDEVRLPIEVRGSVRELLDGKEQFDQHVLLRQGEERDRIQVRIGYVNSNGFADPSAPDKKKKWQGPGS